jgi:DNA-binding PucR family transcriptional regulator
MALRGDADSVELRLVAAGGEEDVRRLADQVADRLNRTVAISREFTVAADRPGAEAEARSTLEAALALDTPPRLARADRLALYRMLGALHRLPDGPRLARAVLEPLLDARPDVRRERLETLRALLAHGGVGEAAAALGVHRNTVAYRLRRIEAATGWRLADPELRLPLAVALGLVQDDQV